MELGLKVSPLESWFLDQYHWKEHRTLQAKPVIEKGNP